MKLNLDYRKVAVPYGQQTFTIEARPLDIAAWQAAMRFLGPGVMDALEKAQESEDARRKVAERTGNDLLESMTREELCQTLEAIIPEHVSAIEGITLTEQGKERACTPQDLCTKGALTGPAVFVVIQLLQISQLTADDAGNSAGPEASTSPRGGRGARGKSSPAG